jgi:hypothetical protein
MADEEKTKKQSEVSFAWEQQKKKERRFAGTILFFASAKNARLWTASALAVATVIVFKASTYTYIPIISSLTTGGKAGQSFMERLTAAKERDESAPAPKLKERLEPLSRAAGTEFVSQGQFGDGEYAARQVSKPKSIGGVMSSEEAQKSVSGVALGKAPAFEDAVQTTAASLPGAAAAATPVIGEALEGDTAIGAPGSFDMKALGVDTPAQARAATAQGSRKSARQQGITPGKLRGMLGGNVQLDLKSAQRFTGYAGENGATFQLSQVRLTSQEYSEQSRPETVAMAGAAYDKLEVPLKSVAGDVAPLPVSNPVPNNPGAGPQKDPRTVADCAEEFKQTKVCRQKLVDDYLAYNTLHKQLTDLGVDLAIECGGKCPSECGACNAKTAERDNLCQDLKPLMAKIEAGCPVSDKCKDSAGSATSLIPSSVQAWNCNVQYQCGTSDDLWGKVVCDGVELAYSALSLARRPTQVNTGP